MSRINYRDVRSTPFKISKLSDLENDLNLMTDKEVEKRINDLDFVTSVNGISGAVTLNLFSGNYSDLAGTPVLFSGNYNDLTNKPTIPIVRRIETFSGVTNASGNFTVIYSTPYPVVPDVQPQLTAGLTSQVVRITVSTTTGFTVQVTNRASVTLLAVEVLLAATTPVANAAVSVLVTAR